MRRKLFEQNYKLLSKIAGELLTDDEPKFALIHKPQPIAAISEYGAFIEWSDKNLIIAGTFYHMDNFKIVDEGDFVSDPEMTILFNNELKIARITDFYINNPKTGFLMGNKYGVLEIHFDCTENSNETEEEREYNDYLNQWLKEIAEKVKTDKTFFTKQKIDNSLLQRIEEQIKQEQQTQKNNANQ